MISSKDVDLCLIYNFFIQHFSDLASALGENRNYTVSTPIHPSLSYPGFRSGIIFFVWSIFPPTTPSRCKISYYDWTISLGNIFMLSNKLFCIEPLIDYKNTTYNICAKTVHILHWLSLLNCCIRHKFTQCCQMHGHGVLSITLLSLSKWITFPLKNNIFENSRRAQCALLEFVSLKHHEPLFLWNLIFIMLFKPDLNRRTR